PGPLRVVGKSGAPSARRVECDIAALTRVERICVVECCKHLAMPPRERVNLRQVDESIGVVGQELRRRREGCGFLCELEGSYMVAFAGCHLRERAPPQVLRP